MNNKNLFKNELFIRMLEYVLAIVIVLIAASCTKECFVYADYNITSNYCKTEFNSTKWIQSYHNCTLNTTTGLIYLNKSAESKVYDDYTTYIENDGVNRFSETTTRVTITNIGRPDLVWLYKNYAGNLQTFTMEFIFKITSITNTASTIRFNPVSISSTLDTYMGNRGAGLTQFGIQLRSWSSSTGYNLLLFETWGIDAYTNGATANILTTNIAYYVRLTKSGTTLNMKVDNDSDFSSPITDYTLTLHANHNLNYIMMPQSAELSTAYPTSGYMEYLWWGDMMGGYEEKGVIYTKDLLANTTEKSLIIGINGTAQSNTRIRLYTSTDNATWFIQIDNNGLGQQELYEEILYEYSTLYVRVNITTTDNAKTPYLDELFYLHTALEGCAAPIIDNPYWIAILFISTPIIIMLLLILRRKG